MSNNALGVQHTPTAFKQHATQQNTNEFISIGHYYTKCSHFPVLNPGTFQTTEDELHHPNWTPPARNGSLHKQRRTQWAHETLGLKEMQGIAWEINLDSLSEMQLHLATGMLKGFASTVTQNWMDDLTCNLKGSDLSIYFFFKKKKQFS
jgi:hypothetical protein